MEAYFCKCFSSNLPFFLFFEKAFGTSPWQLTHFVVSPKVLFSPHMPLSLAVRFDFHREHAIISSLCIVVLHHGFILNIGLLLPGDQHWIWFDQGLCIHCTRWNRGADFQGEKYLNIAYTYFCRKSRLPPHQLVICDGESPNRIDHGMGR